jgi:hypothetical protein
MQTVLLTTNHKPLLNSIARLGIEERSQQDKLVEHVPQIVLDTFGSGGVQQRHHPTLAFLHLVNLLLKIFSRGRPSHHMAGLIGKIRLHRHSNSLRTASPRPLGFYTFHAIDHLVTATGYALCPPEAKGYGKLTFWHILCVDGRPIILI